MRRVSTPDGWGQVLKQESVHGRTSYLVKGAGFEGWYDGLQVTSDFADELDPNDLDEQNETTLPYPSRPQGPGKDESTSSIPPDVDPHLEYGSPSDSLTGEPTSEDPVEADIEGLFEPSSHLAGSNRARRVHFATQDDILDVSTIPDDSPTGLENSPINPDGVSTDDLFEDEPLLNLEHQASTYDRLVIEDDLSFLKYASDDDKKEQGEDPKDYEDSDDADDDSDFGDDSDSDESDSESDDDGDSDSESSDGDSGGDGSGDGGGGHTAAFALTTTADLHFLANLCACAETLPLHSKSEHRELVAEGGLKDKKKKGKPLGSKPLKGHHGDHDPKTPGEAGYTKGAAGIAKAVKKNKKPRQDKGQWGVKKKDVSRPIQYAAADGVTPQPRDLDKLLERYEQDQFTYQESNLDDLVDHSLDDADDADLYNKLSSLRTAAPAPAEAAPTQIESQIEQLMQFWATDNNNWWHWTGSQADLALLNQMQQQMMMVGAPSGPPGQMQAQSSYDPDEVRDMLVGGGDYPGEGFEYEHSPSVGHVYYKTEPVGNGTEVTHRVVHNENPKDDGSEFSYSSWLHGVGDNPHSGSLMGDEGRTVVTGDLSDVLNHHADVSEGLRSHGFVIESSTPKPWREYLQTVASDRLVALSAWRDVVEKSKRLRSEGAVDVEAFRPDVITAYIQGDHGKYYTTVQRLGSLANGVGKQGLTSTQISGWSCECDWGHWAWIRKRSFVGRMCSHAYALFSEMRSLDAKTRRRENKGKPIGGGQSLSSVAGRTAWTRNDQGGFEWVSDDLTAPTAAIIRIASGWDAQVWSDGTADDSLSLGVFGHSEQARRAVGRIVSAHMRVAEMGDVDVVGSGSSGDFEPFQSPGDISGGYDQSAFEGDGTPESLLQPGDQEGSAGIQEGTTRTGGYSIFAADDGQDDEGPESDDDGIEEEDDPSDEESLDEEIAEDENDASDGQDDEPVNTVDDDGGVDVPHKRDDEGTDNPGDESDDDGIEKESSLSVADLQSQFGLSHLAGANYSPAQQEGLVREGEGSSARNRGDLNLAGTHYESANKVEADDDVLTFLF